MTRPTFSIVIPSHNYAHFLTTTLDSIYEQRRDDVQAILVDDASTDRTPEVAAAYPQVEYVRLDENVGPGRAWAIGLERATGRYITKLDADDWQLPGWFDRVEAAFGDDAKVGLVAGSAVLVYEDDGSAVEEVTPVDRVLSASQLRQTLLRKFFFRMPAVCLRTAILDGAAPPRHDLRLPHDWEYFIRVTHGWKGTLIHEPIGAYRIHSGSLTVTSKDENRLRHDFDRMYDMICDPADPAFLPEDERRVLATGMAISYLGSIGPRLYLGEPTVVAHHVGIALSLARRGGLGGVARTVGYMGHETWQRLRNKLGAGRTTADPTGQAPH